MLKEENLMTHNLPLSIRDAKHILQVKFGAKEDELFTRKSDSSEILYAIVRNFYKEGKHLICSIDTEASIVYYVSESRLTVCQIMLPE